MIRYPNSDCEKHRDVTTDTPICPICLVEKVDAQAAEIELLRKSLKAYSVKVEAQAAEIERLQAALDEIVAYDNKKHEGKNQYFISYVRVKAIARAAREREVEG